MKALIDKRQEAVSIALRGQQELQGQVQKLITDISPEKAKILKQQDVKQEFKLVFKESS